MNINEQQNLGGKENNFQPQNTESEKRKDMDFKIISPAGGELIANLNVPKSQLLYKLPCSVTDVVKSRAGELHFHCFTGVGFKIWLSIYNIIYPVTLIGKANFPVHEWHNFIENCFKNTWDKVPVPKPRCHQSNLSFAPWVDNVAEFIPGRYVTCDFHFEFEMLEHYAKHYPILYRHLEMVDKGKDKEKGFSLTSDLNLLSDSLRNGIDKIINCDYPESLVPEFYDHQVRLLLMEMLHTVSKKLELGGLQKVHLDTAVDLRDYIVKNISEDLKISKLARIMHVSESTLQRAFKQKFNMTIHDFIMQERLRLALSMLRDPQYTMEKIANATRSKDPKYFFEFWKRFYPDITPDEWRKINS
jgi:AraC-like DNA-binding protein